MFVRSLAVLFVVALSAGGSHGQNNSTAEAIDAYLQPYTLSGNFAGSVVVEKEGNVIFERSYGFADRERRVPNTAETRFHIASISMQFTAVAVLRLVDGGSLTMNEPVSDFVRGIEGADKITIRDLLTERSGLPDINALPNYEDLLQHHQTPSRLVAEIEGKPLLFEPGSKFLHEEHSAYNLLALIVEKKTGLRFAAAVEDLVFRPLGLSSSGLDDDSVTNAARMAKGYRPEGTYALKPAEAIHWSGKTGSASAYTTANDEVRWVEALFRGHVLSAASRNAVLDTSMPVGYGWFKGENKRFGKTAYYMNGRSPGFSSFALYFPDAQTAVILLSNIYSSATTPIGYDIAALSLGLPYEKLHFIDRAPSPAELKTCTGTFQFGPDFYQANAKVTLIVKGRELSLRWPSGDFSVLLPLDRDRFVDRSYWEEVRIERDPSGKPTALLCDHFQGMASDPP
jgi:CubicO group peptidase (beta-lactamase class C family)